MSRLEDAAKVKALEAQRWRDDAADARAFGERPRAAAELERYAAEADAEAALLRSIDRSELLCYRVDPGTHDAALALADTLLPTEGTKP